MFDKEKFGEIIKKINDSYPTQYEFADRSGVNRTYLSQYINLKLDEPPKPKILEKIANASKGFTTYNELMNICGYVNITDSFFDDSIISEGKRIPVIDSVYVQNGQLVTDFFREGKEQYIYATFALDKEKVYFAYKTNDESMSPLLGIGDIAIVEQTNTYEDDQTYLFSLDNIILIRKLIDLKTHIELQPINYHFDTIKLTSEEMNERNFKILGEVVKAENQSAFKKKRKEK